MKGLMGKMLLVSGLAVGQAAAQEVQWRPVVRDAGAGVSLGSPVPLSGGRVRPAVWQPAAPAPAIRLLRGDDPKAGDAKKDDKDAKKSKDAKGAFDAPPPTPYTPAPRPLPADGGPDVWGSYAADPYANPLPCEGLPDVEHVGSEPVDGGLKVAHVVGLKSCSFSFGAEYLLWGIKNDRVPVLATTGPASSAGILGQPGTTVLFGGGTLDRDVQSGGRFTAAAWCDEERTFGVEGSAFFLGERSVNFLASSPPLGVLARPFFNLNLGQEFTEVVGAPGLAAGTLKVEAPSRLWGAEANLRGNLCCGCSGRLDLLAGFRYLELKEGLHITEFITATNATSVPPGTRITVSDRFDTRNEFWGGQLGLDYELRRGPWSIDMRGKLGLGSTHQTVSIGGNQLLQFPNGTISVANGGALALSTNSGRFTRDRFSVVPEFGATLGYDVTDWWRLTVGYNFLYLSSVVRPGDQIDRVVDVTNIPNFQSGVRPTGLARPAPTLRDTDFWAQGVSFGMEFRW